MATRGRGDVDAGASELECLLAAIAWLLRQRHQPLGRRAPDQIHDGYLLRAAEELLGRLRPVGAAYAALRLEEDDRLRDGREPVDALPALQIREGRGRGE